jgi:lactoylglutathione lyase
MAALRCELFPHDLNVAVDFYVQVLGFQIVRDERQADAPYVALERGHVRLGLARRPAPADQQARRPSVGVELVLEVDDLDADHERIVLTGWPLEEDLTAQPWGLRDFRLLDPAGYFWRVTTR